MIDKFKALPLWAKFLIIWTVGIITLAIVVSPFLPEIEDEDTTEAPTEAKEEEIRETFNLTGDLVYDDLFEKYLIIYEVTITNHRDRNDTPNHNFKFFNSSGAEVQRTFVYKFNDNDCGLSFPQLRPGGTVRCTIAYEVTHTGVHELEVYLGKRGPWRTYPFDVKQ